MGVCVCKGGARSEEQSQIANRRPDTDEGPLGITGTWTWKAPYLGGWPCQLRSQPAWRGAPSPNSSSGGRVRREARWLRFKSLMHWLAGQWRRGCGGGGRDPSAGEQGPGRLTDNSSGPAEAPASAPGGAPSSAPSATCAATGKSRSSPSRSCREKAKPGGGAGSSSASSATSYLLNPDMSRAPNVSWEAAQSDQGFPNPRPLLCHSQDQSDLLSGETKKSGDEEMRGVVLCRRPWKMDGNGQMIRIFGSSKCMGCRSPAFVEPM